MLGYKTYEAPIWSADLAANDVIIELQAPLSCSKEVVVTDSLKAGEIMRLALSRIEQNYPMERLQLEGFIAT